MNKSGGRVNKLQLREGEKCLNDYQKGKLGMMTVEACTTADRSEKVQSAFGKTVRGEEKACLPLNPPPPFGYTDSATVNQAARDGALALIHHIFGDPLDDADLATNAADKSTASCQKTMLKMAGALEKIILGQINAAKKQALKAGAADAAALEDALDAVFTSNAKIGNTETKLEAKVNNKCAALTAPPGAVFPGVCAAATLSEVEECVIAATRCEACLKISAFDDLSLDCDDADDQVANGSCPLSAP